MLKQVVLVTRDCIFYPNYTFSLASIDQTCPDLQYIPIYPVIAFLFLHYITCFVINMLMFFKLGLT